MHVETTPIAADVRRVREVVRCYGNYRAQRLEHALTYCRHCGVLKSCVQRAWRRRGRRSRGWMEKRA